jgi:AraC-like DNA-binding protein/mannose-6-phosphate isomerase-like protein (cupin superfamily)
MADGLTYERFREPDTLRPITYVGRCLTSTGSPGELPPHTHLYGLEVCYVAKGHLEWWTGTAEYELHPHDVLVTLPRTAHGAVASTLQPCEYHWVHIHASAVPANVWRELEKTQCHALHKAKPEIGRYVVQILEEHKRRDEHSASACRALASLILVMLARDAKGESKPAVSLLVQTAQRAFLEEGMRIPSVESVARGLRVSSVWLTKRFRQETGESPGKWLRGRKMAEARKLLALGEVSVGDIAARLGFTSSQYFATAFRRETGMTPTEFRDLGGRPGEIR